MQQELLLKTAFYQVRYKRWRTWKRVLWILSSVVVFVTTYALILPAITMEPDYICGMEAHVHGEDCYSAPEATAVATLICTPDELGLHEHTNDCYNVNGELDCGIADFVLHTHTSDCFDANGELVCTLPEIKAHIHGETCWQQPHIHTDLCYVQQRDQLLCTMEEGSVHTHLDTCFISQDNLICTLPEMAPHTHTAESCFEESKELVCTQPEVEAHTHSDGCYTVETTKICAEEEGENHTHTDACFQTTAVITCSLPETAGHLHSDACYSEPVYTLTCTIEETEGHTHSSVCYETVRVVTCAFEENVAHVHTDSCYICTPVLQCVEPTAEDGAVPVLNCGEQELFPHTHEAACFDQNGDCICGLLQVFEHIHGDTCFVITQEQATEPVLSCGFEEHEHSEICIAKEESDSTVTGDTLIAQGYYCGVAEHLHASEYGCFAEDGTLMCTMAQHEHNWVCELLPADLTAVETAEEWEADLPELQSDLAADLIAVAESQLGYEQSEINYIIENDEQLFYSRYGAWWDEENPYGDWNAKFVSFCLTYAGITDVPLEPETARWPETLDNSGLWNEHDGEFRSIPGDLVFFDTERVGIIANIDSENNQMTVILERNGKVRQRNYALDDADIVGYARIPGNEPSVQIQPQPGEIIMPETFFYEDEWLTMTLSVTGCAALPENAVLPEGEMLPEPALTVRMLDDESNLYYQLFEAAQNHGEEGDLLGLTAMELQFWYGEYQLDTTACAMTAQITLKETLLAPPMQTYSLRAAVPTPAPEAENGVEVAVIQADGTAITGTDTAFFETGAPSPTMTFAVTNNVIAVATTTTANPHFTVQYYANLERASTRGDAELTVIDTSGGNLPGNGNTALPTKNLYLDAVGGGKYKLATQTVLSQVYSDKTYQYITAPNLLYFNQLYENAHYDLKEIWILNEGASTTSLNRGDWTIYSDLSNIHFTNREQSASNGTMILIEDNTVIRLVYDTTSSIYNNAALFHDYDISDGSRATGTYTYNGKTYDYILTQTTEYGINSAANYSGAGTKLAFGNHNAGTNFGTLTWNQNELNKYNNRSLKGCTFGLATGLDAAGHVQYASGVIAPKLFNDGPAIGKTSFDQYSLDFDRVGDTYTLSAVQGTNAANLQYFNNPNDGTKTHTSIFTNNFWPMDAASTWGAAGHDMKFGSYLTEFNRLRNTVSRLNCLPKSDDGLDHNSYFGMQYSVQFKLTENYVGPLEYYFFGDDDMWVFLDGQLVCDIGGVHSSVGEYVNLWDYIKKGSSGTHTLSFFYTERGASGSSCYMQFTLPSVSSLTPEQNTGHLRVEKESVGAVPDLEQEFTFDIHFKDADGNHLPDDYAYTRYRSDGTVVETDIILFDGGSFKLKHGEYIIVKYLPIGTVYTVEERQGSGVYSVTVGDEATATATGTIATKMATEIVRYTNTFYYALPETGGGGAMAYRLMGSGMLLTLPILYAAKRRYRGRRVNGG